MTVFGSVADEFVGALKAATMAVSDGGEFTKKMKLGKIMYFVDVKEAKNASRYIAITESQPSKEDPNKLSRRSITVFDNATNDFVEAAEEAVGHLK